MKKPSMISILLFLTGLLCIIALIFFNRTTLHQILTTEKEVDTISEQITAKHDEVKQAVDKYTTAIDTVQSNINRMKQKQQTATQKKTKEKAEIPEESSSKPSVFSQNSTSAPSDSSAGVFSSDAETGGHIIGIDPGHQSESVDMSAPEPNGPGSSEMKAKCTSGTQGTYSGVPEYQLNLEVSLQLKDELEQRGVMLIGVIVVLSVFLAWLLSTILVKPLARVTKSIEDLTDGVLDEEISVPDYTETELITDAFNKMVNRMKILDESRQEFVSNVSHELKTPLTSMKVLADSLVGQQGVPEELYQEFMSDITAEIDRENKIITDLLSLVKMDKKAADVNITHMDINQLLEDILKRLRPIADRRNIDLILDCFRPVDADVDEVKFTLAVSNLVENGIKYNVDDGWVRVSLDADHKYFYITVADSGMGIPEDSIERIFERFYRVDKSHSKEIGGTGLGLAITKSSVAMHHGTIKVFSKEGEGTTFSVRIPLSYIPS